MKKNFFLIKVDLSGPVCLLSVFTELYRIGWHHFKQYVKPTYTLRYLVSTKNSKKTVTLTVVNLRTTLI